MIERWFPFLVDPDIPADIYRRKLFVMIGCGIVAPVLAYFMYLDYRAGKLDWVGIEALGIVLMGANVFLIRGSSFSLWPSRVVMAFFFATILLYVCEDYGPFTLYWALILPVLSLFVFGQREGMGWSVVIFLVFGSTIVFPEYWSLENMHSADEDFVVAYVILTACSYGYEMLRVRAEARADARAERLQQFLRTSSDWSYVLDKDLTISYVSPRWEDATGIPVDDVVGKSIFEQIEYYEGDVETHRRQLLAHEPFRDLRVSIRLPSGANFHFSTNGDPTYDAKGEFTGYFGSGSDVTAVEESRQEIAEKERQLYQSQKMETVGQLTSGIAHDFNNLLTVIRGYVELMSLQEKPDPSMLSAIERAADRAGELTSRILTFSRTRTSNPEVVDVRDVVLAMQSMLSRTLGENIDFNITTGDNELLTSIDPAQLESAVLNLSINARDAMDGSGTLSINTSAVDFDDKERQGGFVRITVSDNGPGIPVELIDRVTEPFFSTKPAHKGTGLGLSMVNGFVTQSGGFLEIEAGEGHGASISILLPLEESVVVRQDDTQKDLEISPGKTILVVEDDEEVRRILEAMLTSHNIKTHLCSNADEALAMIPDVKPDILISDIVLTGQMSGIELSRTAKEKFPGLAVMLITGYTGGPAAEAEDPVLKKPFTGKELMEAIHELDTGRKRAAG